jgi:hypothetical protein
LSHVSNCPFNATYIGGVDLMLHLLSNIIKLPVTKSIVKESGMGKAIGSLEKHKLFLGTPNEQNIKDRVQQIKEAWHKSVKALRDKVSYSNLGNVPGNFLDHSL